MWPLWFAVAWVISGTKEYAGSQDDYWSAAPWIIVSAAPACAGTTALAFAARYSFHRSEGGLLRKLLMGALVYLGVLPLYGIFWKGQEGP